MADEQFIIFRLGDQEYGMPIAAVDEIARPPERVTRLPKAPCIRRRRDESARHRRSDRRPAAALRRRIEGTRRRRAHSGSGDRGGKTGFMVDSVSEVLKVPPAAIRPAPELSAEQMRLIGRIANFDAQGRMILLVDPAQLLDQVEADMLKKFDRSPTQPAPKAS